MRQRQVQGFFFFFSLLFQVPVPLLQAACLPGKRWLKGTHIPFPSPGALQVFTTSSCTSQNCRGRKKWRKLQWRSKAGISATGLRADRQNKHAGWSWHYEDVMETSAQKEQVSLTHPGCVSQWREGERRRGLLFETSRKFQPRLHARTCLLQAKAIPMHKIIRAPLL